MRICLLFFTVVSLASCVVVNTDYDKLPPGPYRGAFLLDGRQSQRQEPDEVAANFDLDDVARGELPINFEIGYDPDSSLNLTLINGEERIAVPNVSYRRLLATARDSITVRFPLNDAYFTGYHEDGILEGYYVDETRDSGRYRIPFLAEFGRSHRFTDLRKEPAVNVTGRWSVTFGVEDSTDQYPAIAEFVQTGNQLRGTFLTTTGDFRYLDGTIQDNKLYLSTFDGSHVFLFTAKLQADGSLLGIFRSGTHYQTLWEAKRDDDARLPDPTAETQVVAGDAPVEIDVYHPLTRKMVSLLGEDELAGKYKVLTLMGSWCPNCKDEALFLDSLRSTLPADRIAFAGLAFERFRDTSRALAAIDRFRERLALSYPIYYAGFANKAEATAQLGFLDRVRSFPTLIVLDPRNTIVYTHTGFAGPATSAYGDFTQAFAKTLNQLLADE